MGYAQKSKLSITHCDIIFNCSEILSITRIKSNSIQQHWSTTSIIVNNVIYEFAEKLAISI